MKLLYILLLQVCCISYSQSKQFDEDGVKFNIPEDWTITEIDSLAGEGYYLAVEKIGLNESALLTVTWLNGNFSREVVLASVQDDFKKNPTLKKAKIKFEKPIKSKFGSIDCIASKFNFNLMGLKTEGTLYCFYGEGKTFSIIRQEALEDRAKNKSGFDILEASFIVP